MRKIHISNEKKRDAEVGFELNKGDSVLHCRTMSGKNCRNVRFLKSTLAATPETLVARHPDLAGALIDGDPEIDIENAGRTLCELKKIYLSADGKVAHSVLLTEHMYQPDGAEKGTRPLVETAANIALENYPLRWTGKMIPRETAIRKFVFTRSYQLRHVNGLTFDFLYDMAQKLSDARAVLLLGGGEKGTSPLVFTNNGSAYRGFLEGRVDGTKYLLILHLTNLELKEINPDEQ